MADPAQLILDDVGDGIARIRLNRPEARNALTLAMWQDFGRALDTIGADEGVRSVVIAGEGGYFSAGGDMKTPPAGGTRALAPVKRLAAAHAVIAKIQALPVPVIAAVERGAAGLGWSLALACDVVIAGEDAMFSAPFLKRGVVPDGGAGWFLVRALGRRRAADLLLTGQPMPAAEALDAGLVTSLCAPGAALLAAQDYAGAIPPSPHATELTKQLLHLADRVPFDEYLRSEMLSASICQTGPEAAAARAAFARKPS